VILVGYAVSFGTGDTLVTPAGYLDIRQNVLPLGLSLTRFGDLLPRIITLAIVIVFAKNRGASLEQLGLKNISLKVLAIVSVFAVLLSLLQISIFCIFLRQETVFGLNPLEGLYYSVSCKEALAPRDSFQLVALIGLNLVLAGPSLELAFRGFIQKGLENSFGRMTGLLIASGLYASLNILSGLCSIVPALVVGLVFGYVWQQTDGNTIASALMNGLTTSIALVILYFS
jgi:membrane protease YdiL (CAAX protease family)